MMGARFGLAEFAGSLNSGSGSSRLTLQMHTSSDQLDLRFGLSFEDLYRQEGLARLDQTFLEQLHSANPALAQRLLDARANPGALTRKQQSELIIELAPHVEDFIGELFGISAELRALQAKHHSLAPIYALKRQFVQKKAISGVSKEQASAINGLAVAAELEALFDEPLTEASFVEHVSRWLDAEQEHAAQLKIAAQYAAWAALSPAGMEKHRHGVLFRVPHKLEMTNLVPVETLQANGVAALALPEHHWRHREGFKLTDAGMDLTARSIRPTTASSATTRARTAAPPGSRRRTASFKSSVFGVTLAGCPLEEKISEMNVVKQEGNTVGALAIVTIDNPMAAGTGHRICNDCMKSCIFQKQDPVDIPQVETRTLKDVLELPWGFEIYSLLTRWNPLNFARPLPRPDSGYKVLVVGLGPGRIHAGASPDERRPHGGGGRRVEDRAAAGGCFRRRRVRGRTCSVPPDSRCERAVRVAR